MEQKDIEKICALQSNKETYVNQLNQLKEFKSNYLEVSDANHKLYIGDEDLVHIILNDIEMHYIRKIDNIETKLEKL